VLPANDAGQSAGDVVERRRNAGRLVVISRSGSSRACMSRPSASAPSTVASASADGRCRYGVRARAAGRGPTKGLGVQFAYGGCGIHYVNVRDYIAGSTQARLSRPPASDPTRSIALRFDGRGPAQGRHHLSCGSSSGRWTRGRARCAAPRARNELATAPDSTVRS
jgi:hypothetical protein